MVQKALDLKAFRVLTAFHHGGYGSSKSICRLVHFLSHFKSPVTSFFFEQPYYFDYTPSQVNIKLLKGRFKSEVLDESFYISFLASDQISKEIDIDVPTKLLAASLFPYGEIMLQAKLQSTKSHQRPLILHPTGSDIWCIGYQMLKRVKWLMEHPQVDAIVTYSEQFANEIKQYFGVSKEISICPPVPDTNIFYPISQEERLRRRTQLGYSEDFFIISHHSNMRRVKCPSLIIEIVRRFAKKSSRPVILLMCGPLQLNILKEMNIALFEPDKFPPFKTSHLSNLTIVWTGYTNTVENFIQIADVELNCSLHDSFNISLSEAMACGVPVISSDIVGIAPHILKAECGYLFRCKKLNYEQLNLAMFEEKVNYFDLDSAVELLAYLEQNPSNAKKMGEAGHNYARETFTYEPFLTLLDKL